MERLRDSVTGKVLSVVLMLCLTFLGSLLGFKALLASEYASAGSWRESAGPACPTFSWDTPWAPL